MRIFIISRGYPTKKYKLNGIFEYDQAKALVQAGNEVILAANDMRSIRRWRKWGYESLEKDGLHIEALNIPCGRVPKSILNKTREISLKRLYSKIVKKYGEPDIIHSHFLEIGYATVRALGDKNTPIILTEHLSTMNQNELPSYFKKIGNLTYHKVDRLLTVSSLLSNSIKKNFEKKSIVIPNIVDSSSFSLVDRNFKDDSFTFISTGSLIKRKAMDILIKAFNEAFRDKKNVYLYIYGEGPERNNLESLIKQLNLTNQVFLMGMTERKEISKKMQESHCFVLASKLETFGVAYIEAMATGLPVIATNCGGPEEFVNQNNGILIPIDNQNELARAMKYMEKNAKNYKDKMISNEVREKFSSQTISNQLIEIYSQVIGVLK